MYYRTRYLWQRLRDTILDTANASLENDAKERHVSHGVHFQRQIMHRNPINMAFLNTKNEVGLCKNVFTKWIGKLELLACLQGHVIHPNNCVLQPIVSSLQLTL